MKTVLTLMVCLTLLAVVCFAFGQAPPKPEAEPEVEEADELIEEGEEDDEEEIEALDRNVRLDFKLEPLEQGDRGAFIITGTPEYKLGIEYKGEGSEIEFWVSGEVEIRDDGKILVTYDVTLSYEGNNSEAEFNFSAGVLLQPGEELETARVGDKTLVVKADFLDKE